MMWLSTMYAVARQEWRQLVHTRLTALFQIWFLLALAICIFLIADFFATDHATLDLQWTFLPWIALVMAPALAMRSFAENAGDSGLELFFSLPIPISALVFGKWVSGTAILLITLAMTAPFIATVAYLGDPDWGVVVAGYLGAVFLLAAFYAAALLAASLTRDQISAYVLGLGFLSVLLLTGWDLGSRFGDGPTGQIITVLTALSPKHWFSRMTSGEVPVAAITYFIALIGLALSATVCVVGQRRSSGTFEITDRIKRAGTHMLALLGAIIILFGVTQLSGVIDATSEQEFTLHPETINAAQDAPEGVHIDFYYSADETAIPARIRAHARRTQSTLENISSKARGRISLAVHRIEVDSNREEAALASGIRRIPMTSGDTFMLGAVFRHGNRNSAISYFDSARDRLLEYDLTLAIDSLGKKKIPSVGLLSPLLRPTHLNTPREGLAILEEVKRQYDVAIIPHFSETLPKALDTLVVIDAPILKPEMLCAINRHVVGGGGLIVMIDPYPRFNRGNAAVSPTPDDDGTINDISDLLSRYGAHYLGPHVIGDAQLAAPVAGSDNRQLSYPFWLRASQSALSDGHSVTASLNELLFAEAGAFRGEKRKDGVDALVRTGRGSGALSREKFKDASAEVLAGAFKPDEIGGRIIAVSLKGPFRNVMAGCTAPDRGSDKRPGQIFAVADADWLFDPMSLQNVTANGRTVARPLNDNVTFLLNMLEFASGSPRLIGIRSRGRLQRSFTRIADMLRVGQEKYRDQEAKHVTRISEVDSRIAQVMKATGASRVEQLPDEIRNQVTELRAKLLPFRRELREIRRRMREDVERLGRWLTMINLFGGPLLVIAFAAFMQWFRARRT